jgi:hypothetical protein
LEFLKYFQNEKEKKYLDFLLNEEKYMANNKKQRPKEISNPPVSTVADLDTPNIDKDYVNSNLNKEILEPHFSLNHL